MTRAQLLIGKLAEECMEVAQVAMKIQQFGMNDCHPNGGKDNRARLHEELDHIMCALEMLEEECGLGYVVNEEVVADKKRRVNHYTLYAISLGNVTHL